MGAGTAHTFPLGSWLTTDASLCLPALTDGSLQNSSLFLSVSLYSSRLCHIFYIFLKFSGVKIHFHGVVELSPWFPPLSPRPYPPVLGGNRLLGVSSLGFWSSVYKLTHIHIRPVLLPVPGNEACLLLFKVRQSPGP